MSTVGLKFSIFFKVLEDHAMIQRVKKSISDTPPYPLVSSKKSICRAGSIRNGQGFACAMVDYDFFFGFWLSPSLFMALHFLVFCAWWFPEAQKWVFFFVNQDFISLKKKTIPIHQLPIVGSILYVHYLNYKSIVTPRNPSLLLYNL